MVAITTMSNQTTVSVPICAPTLQYTDSRFFLENSAPVGSGPRYCSLSVQAFLGGALGHAPLSCLQWERMLFMTSSDRRGCFGPQPTSLRILSPSKWSVCFDSSSAGTMGDNGGLAMGGEDFSVTLL